MRELEKWIWLPTELYPDYQTTMFERSDKSYSPNYKVVELQKKYKYDKAVERVELRFSGDTSVALYLGECFLGRAPASSGGDFLIPQLPMSVYYATKLCFNSEDYPELLDGDLAFRAVVRMSAARLFEFSFGHGGFFLTAHIFFIDGSKDIILSDESWQIRYLPQYRDEGVFSNELTAEPFVNAQCIKNIWHCENAPIPPCQESYLNLGRVSFAPDEQKIITVPMDMIYAGYPVLKVKTDGEVDIDLMCREFNEEGTVIKCHFSKSGSYECLEMHSAGELVVDVRNLSASVSDIEIGFITSCYPIDIYAKTVTSDAQLNQVFETCAHTLKYCRQTLHLDSPRHCELLACTGDYYIESLMTAFTYGDQSLSLFDLRRTAEMLRYRDGEMFHTTYSLIWVQMLWDVYMMTGDVTLLSDCEDALLLLLRRFKSYIGETGLVETPPSFMFVDWLFPDGISTHHPPKALGQTCLNMFYYGALKTSIKIFKKLNRPVDLLLNDISKLQRSILKHLYDEERALFFEGLNTPTPEHLIAGYMPQNVSKKYYRKHSNILAAYFGFFDKSGCQDLLRRVMNNKSLGEVQPYFSHFLLDAVYRNDMREEFTLQILEKWKEPVAECPKGLVEGFYKPEPTYSFDHSHAWGGTPAWSLPLALTGMEILEPGMKKLHFNPSLLGLDYASVEVPTQYGVVLLKLEKGKEPIVKAPQDIEIIL